MSNRDYLREETYAARMRSEVEPALAAARRETRFTAADGAVLFAVRYQTARPRGSAVILHGFGETSEKYRELCYYFLKEGLTVLIFDQRGHGRSERTAPAPLIDVECFSQYVEDFSALLASEAEALPAPRYLFAHSMGGAVAALYLERDAGFFQKAALSSPMIALRYKKAPRAAAYALCAAAFLAGRAGRPFWRPRFPFPRKRGAFSRSGAISRARFECARASGAGNARATYAWVWEALRCTRDIFRANAPARVAIPVRIYAAGRETLVSESAQRRFASKLPRGEFCRVARAGHEIYFSTDDVLHPYLDDVLDFFS